ncbi:lipopolysaccharide biosynthesis [Ruegeria arenilitoris]|uniref:lipopolysaccharide biosynthesis n=1 Tax=Ruegeria arenilitoris TaxID=1173585 RepID=UPI00147AF6A6|nr:lipopolysaccharide biosynthesis [Ruegeria arenilitoris]
MTLIVEAPRIPDDLAASTVRTSAQEQLQILQQRLLTRANLLDIANEQRVFADKSEMTADRIVQAMRARTSVKASSRRGSVPLMQISFEARSGRIAAGVLNDYLTLIQQEDVESRTGRATQTLEFFEREVARLSEELTERNARILSFKTENADALPESLDYRLSQQTFLQERLSTTEREIAGLKDQRENLLLLFENTGQVGGTGVGDLTPERQQLEALRRELSEALAVYSEQNPRVKVLKSRIAQAEEVVRAQPDPQPDEEATGNSLLDVQLAEIATRVGVLEAQKSATRKQLDEITGTINRTPANAIRAEELALDRDNIQQQYNLAVDRLSRASTGERIEVTAQGQRVSVIEPPVVPSKPSKPNRALIAGGGSFFGILCGIALVVLLELLNRSVRRPEDLVSRLGVTPLATIPYIATPGEIWRRRSWKLARLLVIIIAVPAAVYVVHVYYQPLDLIAERTMEKIGIR